MNLRTMLLLLSASTLVPACSIEVGDDGWDDDCRYSDAREYDRDDVCTDYCEALVDCGAIESPSLYRCQTECESAYDADADGTREACECVRDAGCSSSLTIVVTCGAPSPTGAEPTGNAGGAGGAAGTGANPNEGGGAEAGGSPSAGGAPDGGGVPGTAECSVPHDCAAGEDCVDGACQTRCYGSCDCAEGEACVDGYCALPEESPVSCVDYCDCPSGQDCVDGFCV